MTILDELYEWHEMTKGCCPQRREAQKRFDKVWYRAEKVLGEELGEELRNRIFEYMEDECNNDFQTGFRLGVLLMQEVYIPTQSAL